MSLTNQQRINTKNEFKQALELSGLTIKEIATQLNTSEDVIFNTLELNCKIENPWILKDFLNQKIKEKGEKPVKLTALKGNHHLYWFLNSKDIDNRKII